MTPQLATVETTTQEVSGATPAQTALLEHCERLLRLSSRQQAALTNDDLAEFDRLLARRAEVLAFLTGNAPAIQEPVMVAILRRALAIGEQNETLLREKMRQARQELDSVRVGRRLLRRYDPSPQRAGRHLELDG